MNKKVFQTMIILVIAFLMACYVLKIFFPEQFVMAVENETIVKVGQYIDSQAYLYYIFGSITSFITYWLYLCAVCRRWYLNWWHCLMVVGVIAVSLGLTFVDMNLYTAFSVASFVVLPCIIKSDLKNVAICYPIHLFSQATTLTIRNLPLYMSVYTSLNIFILSIDMYFWLLLLYLCFNYRKKENRNGLGITTTV